MNCSISVNGTVAISGSATRKVTMDLSVGDIITGFASRASPSLNSYGYLTAIKID